MYESFKLIPALIESAINGNAFAGANIAVIHKGETVYNESFGLADREKNIQMSNDKIFRLFSLTKPITACAAMTLLEQGKIELRYPLKWFLPTFNKPQVLDEKGQRSADRDITLSDLLSMVSGIPYPDGSPAGQKMGELWGMVTENQARGNFSMTTKNFALEMGKRPLAFSPGEKWQYGASADIMGAVTEVCTGMKYGEYLQKEIFGPLGMEDTGFWIPPEKYGRLAQAYDRCTDGSLRPFTDMSLCLTDYKQPPSFESGGAGLVSTIGDYSKFVKMLMNNGTFNGVRIIGRKTAELMRTNSLNEKQTASLDWDSMKGHGYGSFMRILTSKTKAGCNGSEGEYGWDGWLGCYFSIDPVEDLAMLFFIQQTNSGCTDFVRKLQNVIWGSID